MTLLEPQDRWFAILREVNLDSLFSEPQHQAFLSQRLGDFGQAYARHVRGVTAGVLPSTASLADILIEHERNPHRVGTLLEAAAFQCSPDILAMIWMTLLGARIESLAYEYKRGEASLLRATLLLPDGQTERTFESSDLWDVALFRLATLSKADDQPVIDDFYPIWIPPRHPADHDLYVATAQGDFSAKDVAPSGSTLPHWQIHEVYGKQSPRFVGRIDLQEGGPVFDSVDVVAPERNRALLERTWHALVRKYGEQILTHKPTPHAGR
jgi:hypothetical protein